jgi:hypothetical protein
MKMGTLQGGDSYPGRLAGIKGGQLRNCQFSSVKFSSEVTSEVRRIPETEYGTENIESVVMWCKIV